MINVDWKKAVLSAQKKIDEVLDIRADLEESPHGNGNLEAHEEPDFSTESQLQIDDTDDIDTHPDLLITTNTVTGHLSSEEDHRLYLETESVVIAPDIAIKTIHELKKELHEYKKAHKALQSTCEKLERELEESCSTGEKRVTKLLTEERANFEQEILQYKTRLSKETLEKKMLEEAVLKNTFLFTRVKHDLEKLREQTQLIRESLNTAGNVFLSNRALLQVELQAWQNHENCSTYESINNKNEESSEKMKVLVEESSQTENTFCSETSGNSTPKQNELMAQSPDVPNGNFTALLAIIETLENEKSELLIAQAKHNLEISKMSQQMNEMLVMHGEKIEMVDELQVDNQDLKSIVKQQALLLTHG